MARALEFDYDKAIDKATRVFWKNGYSGTSLRDLLKAIGIGEGSFYNTLKSKKQLYLKCLKRYNDTVVWGSLAILEYLAEKRPQLWPSDPAQRAKARSVAAVRRDPRERAACLTTLAECPLLAGCGLRWLG